MLPGMVIQPIRLYQSGSSNSTFFSVNNFVWRVLLSPIPHSFEGIIQPRNLFFCYLLFFVFFCGVYLHSS